VRLPEAGARAWLDDPALHAGLAVFETVLLVDGRPLDLARHLGRMREGAGRLGIELPDARAIEASIETACRERAAGRAWLKLLATRGGRWLVFTGALQRPEHDGEVAAIVLPFERDARDPLVSIKSTCRASQQLGLELARRHGAGEALWRNTHGRLTEGCASNLFVVRHGIVHTPALREGVLPGIVRECAIAAARTLGVPLHEGRVRRERLARAQEAFLTGSIAGVRPLVRVDGKPVASGEPGPLTRRLAREVERMRLEGW
jgi:branched-subunit amino acid aminotransferase/4-amino-4-deoxychorismate lyase